MILETIDSPADLAPLTYDELATLAVEIRQFIVDSVNSHGGHLGSNLGAVELTLALHRVFDSPRDIVLWDTGHQAYVHKIVTGRRDDFVRLREQGGLSGYPCRAESEHDWIENSHASTILSYAHGMATAEASAQGEGRRVIAVIGDGSMTGGMAFEGLNNLGHSGTDCIIILNDNGRSYAPTVSKLGDSLARIRNNPTYMRRQARIERGSLRDPTPGAREAADDRVVAFIQDVRRLAGEPQERLDAAHARARLLERRVFSGPRPGALDLGDLRGEHGLSRVSLTEPRIDLLQQ